MSRRKTKLTILLLFIAAGAAVFVLLKPEKDAPHPESQSQPQSSQSAAEQPPFDKNKYSIDDPSSLWVIVNKKRPLLASYAPQDTVNAGGGVLKNEAASAAKDLIAAAAEDQAPMKVVSAYRSYNTQQSVYGNYVKTDGQADADTYSARAGHSEHQTGLAADLGNTSGKCDLDICFADTPGGKWLVSHAHEYGFVIRYPSDKTTVTGYQYEPWHVRYVGKELASELHSKNQTMEEFFNLPAAPSY